MTDLDPQYTHNYQIKLCGHLSSKRTGVFAGWEVTMTADGHTILSGAGIDQAALFGILLRIRDLGMPLLTLDQTNVQNKCD